MKTIVLAKSIYNDFFNGVNNKYLNLVFKGFTWFCFSMIGVILYAFVYRVATGFPI